jgi:hypothetical protein
MKSFVLQVLIFLLMSSTALFAQQGQYKIAYNVGTQTYTVYGKVSTAYNPPLSRFVNVFVTVVAPTGAGATRFVPTNLQTAAALASANVVSVSRLDNPAYSAGKDYLFFNFDVGSASYTPAPIVANTEFPIFSFQSQNGCLGDLYIIVQGSTEYNALQSNAINGGQAFSILGAGGDTYFANYGGNATCPAAVTPPTVSVSYSSPMVVGQQGTMTLTLTNSAGNPAQSGVGYTYTLPSGLSFPAGATVTNSCGGTGTISGNTITFANGTMASGMATCTLSAPVLAAAQGTINPSTGSFGSPVNVTVGANNGAGASPVNIVVNPPAQPIVSVAYSNPMVAGQQGTVTLTLTNSAGNPSQTGIGYTYTLPAGLSFPAGATVTNSCGGTGTISGNTITFANGTMASGMATCALSAPVLAAAQGTINPSTGSFTNPVNVAPGANNGAGANPVNIVVNPPACNANAGILGY